MNRIIVELPLSITSIVVSGVFYRFRNWEIKFSEGRTMRSYLGSTLSGNIPGRDGRLIKAKFPPRRIYPSYVFRNAS